MAKVNLNDLTFGQQIQVGCALWGKFYLVLFVLFVLNTCWCCCGGFVNGLITEW